MQLQSLQKIILSLDIRFGVKKSNVNVLNQSYKTLAFISLSTTTCFGCDFSI
jgi:hypothetical protein